MENETSARMPCTVTRPRLEDHRRRKRVLVVDDDQHLLAILSMLLDRLDFEVSLACDGREACDMFRRDYFDLVITDLQMPRMNGQTLIAKIKSRSPKIPVVVMTGLAPEEVSQSGDVAPAAAVLYKPFDLGTLKQTLAETLTSSYEPPAEPTRLSGRRQAT
jgi:CheY-like chemotaxis protein